MSQSRTEVGTNAIFNIGANLFRILLSYLTTVLISRWLGASNFGDASLAISYTVFLLPLFAVGFDHSLVFYVSRLLADRQVAMTHLVLKRTLIISFLVSVALYILIGCLLMVFLSNEERWFLFVLFLAHVPIAAIGYLYGAYLRGTKLILPATIKDCLIVPVVTMVASILFIYFLKLSVVGYALSLIVAYAFGLLYVFLRYLSFRKTMPVEENVQTALQEPFGFRPLVGFSLPIAFANILYVLVPHSSIMIAGILLSSADVGLYSVGVRVATFAQFVLLAVVPAFMPYFSELFKKGAMEELKGLHQSVHYWCAKWALFFVFAVAIAGSYMLKPFGDDFSNSERLLLFLTIGLAIEGAFGATRQSLVLAGKNILNLINCGLAVVINVVIIWYLVPTQGVYGLATAALVVHLVCNLIRCLQFWSLARIGPLSLTQTLRLLIMAAVMVFFYVGLEMSQLSGSLRASLVGAILTLSLCSLLWSERELAWQIVVRRFKKQHISSSV